MPSISLQGSDENTAYKARYLELPAFEVTGFTKIVESGGEVYDELRRDGRWQVLRNIAGDDGTLYGVASADQECPKGKYRYTIGVGVVAEQAKAVGLPDNLFTINIKPSGWLVFSLTQAQYGDFWRADPYALTKKLDYAFNAAVGLHIDVWPPSYAATDDGLKDGSQEFMMPVRLPKPG
jgi:hypothetical protein